MRSSIIAASALFAGAYAQNGTSFNQDQSKPFTLALVSEDESINGTFLTACHTGAAIESLCTYKAETPTQFNVNYTASAVNATENRGLLTYNLIGGNFVASSPMQFSYNVNSNVALPLLQPGYNGVAVNFDEHNIMTVPSGLDDTVVPPTYSEELLDRWYVCETSYLGYQYTTLAWTLGKAEPQNPTCKKVDVARAFV